jgi:hypothetical protein
LPQPENFPLFSPTVVDASNLDAIAELAATQYSVRRKPV